MTRVFKNAYNDWCAEDEVAINDGRILKVTTMKRHNKSLATTVTAGKRDGNFFTYVVFQDFSKTVLATRPARITQGAVTEQHALVIAQIDHTKRDVNEFYGQQKVDQPA